MKKIILILTLPVIGLLVGVLIEIKFDVSQIVFKSDMNLDEHTGQSNTESKEKKLCIGLLQ